MDPLRETLRRAPIGAPSPPASCWLPAPTRCRPCNLMNTQQSEVNAITRLRVWKSTTSSVCPRVGMLLQVGAPTARPPSWASSARVWLPLWWSGLSCRPSLPRLPRPPQSLGRLGLGSPLPRVRCGDSEGGSEDPDDQDSKEEAAEEG